MQLWWSSGAVVPVVHVVILIGRTLTDLKPKNSIFPHLTWRYSGTASSYGTVVPPAETVPRLPLYYWRYSFYRHVKTVLNYRHFQRYPFYRQNRRYINLPLYRHVKCGNIEFFGLKSVSVLPINITTCTTGTTAPLHSFMCPIWSLSSEPFFIFAW